MRPRNVLLVIALLAIVCLAFNIPAVSPFNKGVSLFGKKIDPSYLSQHFPIKLGLDLQGGIELTLGTDMGKIVPTDRDTALQAARDVIEKRVNLFGVSESQVLTSKQGEDRRILVELPGVKDLDTAVGLVGRTAQLEFRELDASASAKESSASATISLQTTKSTGLTGADLKRAQVTFGSGQKAQSGPEVQIEFTAQGAEKFAEITKRNVGKPLAIFLDSQPIEAPIVQQEIIGGQAVISGSFTTESAKSLAIQLNAGALPVPIKILQQRQIAPTLGSEFVQKSLVAGVIGILAVILFMLFYYGLYGLIADLALLLYILLILVIFRTGLFILPPVTLTLAGIAGFVLSIGMAVDANILTFERMKEELRAGKNGSAALEAGFRRSWTSIRDSNISSIITALILYIFGTSVVRGFALTLIIGILVSMFSAVIVTRTFLRVLPRFKK